MSVQGSLRGQCWSQLSQPPDTDPLTGAAQPASVRISPVPAPSDDVMKLPREDMTTFGRCPAWDNFVLVTCDKCDKIVKIEAFESHMTLRHGSKSERSAYHRVLAARAAASLQSCEVKLTPCSTATHSSSSSVGDRRSPAALHPLAEAELPSSSCTSPQPSPSPPPDSEPMDTSDPAESLPHKFVSEEADSTTNNVISIPDTDDMANIEIISEGQSLLDSMDSKFSFAPTSAPAAASVDSTSFTLAASSPKPGSRSCVTPPVPRSALEPAEAASSPGPSLPTPTHYITVSPLSKPSPTKKLVLGRMVQPHVAHPAPPSSEKKSSRDREYDANKHCGVLDPDTKKPCTRSLTCKSHSVYLKRKVLNRSGDFDELLANHKAEKEAAAAKLSTVSAEDNSSSSSILERRLKLAGSPAAGPTRVLGQLGPQLQLVPGAGQLPQLHAKPPPGAKEAAYCEDSVLHYTTGWLRPARGRTYGQLMHQHTRPHPPLHDHDTLCRTGTHTLITSCHSIQYSTNR